MALSYFPEPHRKPHIFAERDGWVIRFFPTQNHAGHEIAFDSIRGIERYCRQWGIRWA
jgi:hypothetical protein